MTLGVIVLAGGRGKRLGGVSKADVIVGHKRCLDWLLDDVAALSPMATVVVAPPSVALPPGVKRALEDPPDGGPAAGLLAGWQVLPDVDAVAVLAVDAPWGARSLPSLLPRMTPDVDGVVAHLDGYRQPLLGVYWAHLFDMLTVEFGAARDLSIKRLLGGRNLLDVDVDPLAFDIDTPEDLARAEQHRPHA